MRNNIFIKRPAMAISISVLIVIIGLISLFGLPIEQYPTIAPPTIQVTATYTGASADAVQKSVIMPLEESINGVEDMIYMTSTATNTGAANISIFFKQGTDPDMAAVNVQNRVAKAQGLLPSEVTRIGVTTQKQQTDVLRIAILYSPDGRYDKQFLDNYMDINVIPRIKRISGVADVLFLGDVYSMRIWLKPDIMAQYGLVPADITAVLGEQNLESPTGALGENSANTFQFTMKYKGRLQNVDEFKNIVVRSLPDGNVLRLHEVADVELGWLSYGFQTVMDGLPSSPIRVFQLAGANGTEINREVAALLEEIGKQLPAGMEFVTILDTNDFLFASIHEVVVTLILAVLLVVLVVYFFLQDLRSTLIPSLSILVSLVGTFAFLYAAGFSINLLTLFALVLAIGTVVDNAIVVVEAVQAKFDGGYKSAYPATRDAMNEVTMAIITCTIVFMAVFIPISFTGGTTGTFYTQFGITMAVAVGISCLNSLTLSPALCALWLHPADPARSSKSFNGRVRAAYNASFNALLGRYKSSLLSILHRRWIAWASLAVSIALLAFLVVTTKTGLVPQEDKGIIFLDAAVAPGSTLQQTERIMAQVDSILLACPEIEHFGSGRGQGIVNGTGTSYASAFARLKHWDERPGREHSADAVLLRLNTAFGKIKNANIFAFQQGMIPGYGQGNSIELHVQDRAGGSMTDLYNTTMSFVNTLGERPEIARAYCAYNMSFPQYSVDVDAAKCKRAGISPSDVLSVLSGYCGGIYASNFNRFSKVYRVMVQASPQYRLDENALDNMYVRSGNRMAPVSQFVTLKRVMGSEVLNRFNLFNSISTSISVADGYSSGQVQQAISEVAEQVLPSGYGYEYGGMAREEAGNSGSGTLFIYLVCVVFIYFILVCLYESFFIPFAVILSVPCGLMGSFLFAKLFGLENNIYLQTGVIMLIGLLAKTAILITEYATEHRRHGMSIVQAAYSAAQIRLRPILMTVLTMVFGMLPLMFATGAGANGNRALGTGIVGGMLLGTLAMLFLTPVFFIAFQYMQEKFFPAQPITDKEE
mgnify:CR=1 FL=1